MIVCVCRGVSDREVKSIARRGVATIGELIRDCGAGGDCGACCERLAELLEEATPEAAAPSPPRSAHVSLKSV
jgi:bacterioferritin-associated ferredoxin